MAVESRQLFPREGAGADGGACGVAADGVLYREPRLYELAFSYRDIVAEVDAIESWCRTRPGRVLELAAGPAAHGRELARRGSSVTALDLSRTMCAYAVRRARADRLAL